MEILFWVLSFKLSIFLPKNSIVDGSVALLKSKKNLEITTKHLEYFSSKEFTEYYKIARNMGTRSLNIDNNSVLFFGLKKDISLNKWEMQ